MALSYWTRMGHWLAAVAVPVLGLSGLEIFRAFPSFGEKLPGGFMVPLPGVGLGGWLGGALQWHVTFAWFFVLAVGLQVFDLARGGWRRVWLTRAEWGGVWPMVRFYFLRGAKPEVRGLYNPLQKLAYLLTLGLEGVAVGTGLLLLQPAWVGLGAPWAWQAVRVAHFASLCGFAAFLPGHLVMVALAGRGAMELMVVGGGTTG